MTELESLPEYVRISQLVATGPYKDQRPIIGVTKQTIINWVKRGIFPQPIRVGRSLMWRSADIRAALARLEQGANRG